MLSAMLEGNLGQFVAPDPVVAKKEEKGPRRKTWMEIFAPDPNYYGDNVENEGSESNNNINNANDNSPQNSSFHTPDGKSNSKSSVSPPSSSDTGTDAIDLNARVLSAAMGTADALKSPTPVWEGRTNFFSLCCSSKSLNAKQIKKMKNALNKNPSLATSYSVQMGTLVPDGYTPLHAAARAGNLEAATVLLDYEVPVYRDYVDRTEKAVPQSHDNGYNDDKTQSPSTKNTTKTPKTKKLVSLQTTDLQGRQPLHVASEHGHTDLVALFRERLKHEMNGVDPIGPQAPVDLSGLTPLGWVCTSREKNAQKNRTAIEKELFSPGDPSICGPFSPPFTRSSRKTLPTSRNMRKNVDINNSRTKADSTSVEFGYAEMCGWRIEMEDALCCHYPVLLGDSIAPDEKVQGGSLSSPMENVGLFGVFDGHGDGGAASRFVADNLLSYFLKSWTEKTSDADGAGDPEAKEAHDDSTRKDKYLLTKISSELDETLKTKSTQINGGSTAIIALLKEHHIVVANIGDSRAILVSLKHNVDDNDGTEDKIARPITKSTIQVKPLSQDHKPNNSTEKQRIENAGLPVIVETSQNEIFHKIQLPDDPNTKIAVSRAFGDFDFKSNPNLAYNEQAVICTPEIMVHTRTSQDQFLILACDGVWDVMGNDEVGQFVYDKWMEGETVLGQLGDELLRECMTRGSRDNMTVLIVKVCYDGSTTKGRVLDFANE